MLYVYIFVTEHWMQKTCWIVFKCEFDRGIKITVGTMTDKVAVITGAARGLGKSFSEALLKRGYKVSH